MQIRPSQSGVRHRMIHLGFLAIAVSWMSGSGCAVNPVTGRSQVVVVSEEKELELGREAADEVEKEFGLVKDQRLVRYLGEVGQRVAKHSQRQNLTYRFHVVDMPEPNAFALPAGDIYVSRGMLAILISEDELATVLGHEVGHVAARHAVARQTASAPLIPLKIAAGLGGLATSVISPSLGAVVAGVGELPGAIAIATYSRSQEREADRLGQEYAAAAGWDPAALSTCMHSLSREHELAGGDPSRSSWLSSHPTSPERSQSTKEFATQLQVAEAAPIAKSPVEFLKRLDGLVVGPSAKQGVFVEDRFLHPDLRIGIDLPTGWEKVNIPSRVAAKNDADTAIITFEIAGEGDDPSQAAQEMAGRLRFLSAAQRIDVNGLPAVQAVAETGSGRDKARIYLLWVASGGNVYRIAGIALLSHWDGLLPTLEATAKSFRRLSNAEMADIREDHLRLVRTHSGQSWETLLDGTGSAWSPAYAAMANGVDVDDAIKDGTTVKITRPEVYRP